MSAPPIYRDTADAQFKRYAIGREIELEIQDIQALADATTVNLFTTATAPVNIATSVATNNDITIGPVGNRIVIDNTTGSEVIRLDGDVEITGSEDVTGATTFNGNVQIGDVGEGDTLSVYAASTFYNNVTLGESTVGGDTITFLGKAGTPAQIVFTDAQVATDLVFDDAAARAITIDSQNLTMSTTSSGILSLDSAGTLILDGATSVSMQSAGVFGVFLDSNGDVVIGSNVPYPIGNTAQLTVIEEIVNTPVITLKSGAPTETSILTGSTDPSGGAGIPAPRGSLYLINTGSLYVKSGVGDTNWDIIGTTAGSTLQAAYTASAAPALITMSTFKNLTFQTNESLGSESDFLVEQAIGGADYLLCDASADTIILGSAGIGISAAADITMTGATPLITADSVNLTISTTTNSNVVLSGADDVVVTTGTAAGDAFAVNSTMLYVDAQNGVTGFGTATPDVLDVVTISKAGDNLLRLINSADAAEVEVLTGTSPTGITGQAGSLYLMYEATGGAKAYLNTSAAATGIVWTELGFATGTDLQVAYDNFGGGPATVTLDATGDLSWLVTAGSNWDIIWSDDNGDDFLKVDETNDAIVLGSTGGTTERYVSFVGKVNTDIAFDGTAQALTNAAANVTVSTTGSGDVILTSAGAVDINSTGIVTVDGTSFSIDGTVASNVSVTAANLTLSTIGTGDVLVTSADAVTVSGDAITLDANNTNGFSIDGTAASNVSVTSGNLTLSTLVGGDVIVTSIGAVNIDGGGTNGLVSIDAAGTGDITLTCANDALADIIFKAHNASNPLQYNDTVNVDLAVGGAFGTAGTTLSIVGALNALDAALTAGDVIASYTTGEPVTKGDLLYLNATTGTVGLADADAAGKTRPIGFANASALIAASVEVVLAGEVEINATAFVAADIGKAVFMDKTTPGQVVTTPPAIAGDTVLQVGVLSFANGVANGKVVIHFGEPTLL